MKTPTSLNPGKCLQCGSASIEAQDVDVNGQTREGWVCDDCGFVMLTPIGAAEDAE